MPSTARIIDIGAHQRERRAHERYPLVQEIRVTHDDHSLLALTEDISLGGARFFLEADARLHVGDLIRCHFALPHLDEELSVEAEVRWVHDGACQRVGVQFSEGLRPYVVFALLRPTMQYDRG
jgi:c-di-GMP-binding flagellar brake protein YcgR